MSYSGIIYSCALCRGTGAVQTRISQKLIRSFYDVYNSSVAFLTSLWQVSAGTLSHNSVPSRQVLLLELLKSQYLVDKSILSIYWSNKRVSFFVNINWCGFAIRWTPMSRNAIVNYYRIRYSSFPTLWESDANERTLLCSWMNHL